jgi:hypothetical protein
MVPTAQLFAEFQVHGAKVRDQSHCPATIDRCQIVQWAADARTDIDDMIGDRGCHRRSSGFSRLFGICATTSVHADQAAHTVVENAVDHPAAILPRLPGRRRCSTTPSLPPTPHRRHLTARGRRGCDRGVASDAPPAPAPRSGHVRHRRPDGAPTVRAMIVNNVHADHLGHQLLTIWPPDSSGALAFQARHTRLSELFRQSRCPKTAADWLLYVAEAIGHLLVEKANILIKLANPTRFECAIFAFGVRNAGGQISIVNRLGSLRVIPA